MIANMATINRLQRITMGVTFMQGTTVKARKSFWKDEAGAVTVDWVVLTAAVVGMATLVLVPVATGTESVSGKTATYINDVPVGFMSE